MEKDGYGTDAVMYCWKNKLDNYRASVNGEYLTTNITLPQFDIISYKMRQYVRETSTGKYAQLQIYFIMRRNIGFYVIQIYLPSTLIVVISWVSFWLSRDATPARVALGVTTVLTMTTLMTTTNSAMPKVSYIKAIDIYLGVSFFMVFASLLEYAAVGYLNKKLRMKREKKMQKMNSPESKPVFEPMSSVHDVSERKHRPSLISKAISQATSHGSKHFQMSPMTPTGGTLSSSYLQGGVECDCDIEDNPFTGTLDVTQPPPKGPLKIMRPKRKNRRRPGMLTPSTIDKYSRIIFPVLFCFFNALYWTLLNRAADNLILERQQPFPPVNGSTPETDTCFQNDDIFTGEFNPGS